jgi:ABC-type branched-subunit amino acid transport system ATPase component
MLLFLKFRDLAWGADGTALPNLGDAPLMMQFDAKVAYYYIALRCWLWYSSLRGIERSWMGYYLIAVGEDEDAAEAVGVNATRIKRHIYLISAFLTALVGTFYVQYIYFPRRRYGPVGKRCQAAAELAGGGHGGLRLTVYSLILIAHVMRAIIALARHIVVLDHGQKIAEGTPAQVVANEQVIRAYLEPATPGRRRAVLTMSGVSATYCSVAAMNEVSLTVGEGEAVGLLGANGAGKSTTLRTISGLVRPTAGTITFLGANIVTLPPYRITALGIAHVPEGRQVFPERSLQENLEIGAYIPSAKAERARTLELAMSVHMRPQSLTKPRPDETRSPAYQPDERLAAMRAFLTPTSLLSAQEPAPTHRLRQRASRRVECGRGCVRVDVDRASPR